MPRSHRRYLAAVATGTTLALVVAVGSAVTTIIYHDVNTMWLTIAFTVLTAVLGILCAVVYLHQDMHEHVEATANRLVRRIADKVTLELYVALGNTIREQREAAAEKRDAADRLGEAVHTWQKLTGAQLPIDLREWKTSAASDRSQAHQRRAAADSSAS